MTEKLKKLRDNCTEKQAKFIDLLTEGEEKAESYINAGFKPKNKRIAQQCACKLLTTNNNVITYYEALKAERDNNLERIVNITRTTQLKSLEKAKELAASLKNPSAMVSAIREQNEMLGYHRELAPNAEKEARKQAKTAAEQRLAQEYAQHRTADEAQDKPRTARIGQEAG